MSLFEALSGPPPSRWFAFGAVVFIGASVGMVRPRVEGAPHVVTVGRVVDHRSDTTERVSHALGEMLLNDIAKLSTVRVISPLLVHAPISVDEVVEGTLSQLADGRLRLDLRRITAANGNVRQNVILEGRDPYALVEEGADSLAAAFGR